MSRWFTYTAGLKEDVNPDNILDALDDTVTEELMDVDGFGNKAPLPHKYPEWDVLSRKLGRHSWERSETLSESIAQWFTPLIDDITVIYSINISNTTDSVTIRVIAPKSDQFEEVERKSGAVRVDRDKRSEDEYFPEYAMIVSPVEDPRLGPDRETDHLRDLENEYGARPLIHY